MIGGFFGLSCFEERVKEASSSEAPQKKGPVHTYSDCLEKPRSESLATHQRKVFKRLATSGDMENTNCGESVQPLQS